MLLMQAQENGVVLDEEQLLFLAGGHDTVIDEDVNESPVYDLALNVDNVFQADECDAFDSNVNEAPTTQTMFMANLSSVNLVYDEVGPSDNLDILSKVHKYDNYQDAVYEHHNAHEMHHDVQPNCVVDSNADYTSDSNMILYDQYVKDNTKPVVQSGVSSVPNDAYMMIINEMHEQTTQSVSANEQNKVVNASLPAELATYKEQVELYERRAKFELTEREQKIEEKLRIVITDRNIKEENLKKELHSVKMQVNSTINHNKSMVEEVTSLKKDFKQKENKYLEEFLDMKALKEKVKDKLFKQDQSLQIVHMYAIDVEPIPPRNRNNREVHLDYLKHLKESVEKTLRANVEEQRQFQEIPTPPENKAIAYANQLDPNQNWVSNFPNSPSSSVFKCRHDDVLPNLFVVQSLQEQIMVMASSFKPLELRDVLKTCPKFPGQKFEDPPLEEEILSFIRDLGHTGEIKFLSDVNVNHMYQPWRSFAAIINKCLSGKTTALESPRLSRAQILWGMYHNKNVDYVYLLWEDLVY
ncbi:hypothetical protein Tco_0442580 [Tanacetum coccineum]